MTKKLPDFETWPKPWQENGWNYCFTHAARALEYLAKHERPMGGESPYNAIDLETTAFDIGRSLAAINEYRIELDKRHQNDMINLIKEYTATPLGEK